MKLRDLASVVRSKNAGPFTQTIDVFFDDDASYRRVKESGSINPGRIMELYKVDESRLVGIHYLDAVRGIKIAFIKPGVASGDPGMSDMYGCQQNAPLLDLQI
ncbi:MAG: DUF4387 domain-containing protein [Betaproteobacteria bacterium]|nr:DUF4387 domain-containing protein [Betaproteobacteria bacterium]